MRIFAALAVLLATLACTNGSGHGSPVPAPVPAPASAPVAAALYTDWPAYHGNAARLGYAPTMPAVHSLALAHSISLDGAVYGSPIVVGGRVYVATENDTVYAYSLSGTQLWSRHLGTPAAQSQLPCGNIFPLGITGSPVYETGLIYVAPEYSGSPPTHQVVAVRASDGTVAWHKSIDLPGVEQSAMQERGALNIDGGRVWIPFGGLAGDCGGYKGRVVGVALNGAGSPVSYTVPTSREAGIWTAPGPGVDSKHYLYVSVGNGASVVGDPYDHSDSVLKLSVTPVLHDSFSPTTWATDNAGDADLGSQGPALVAGGWIFIAGKSGTAYVLNRTHFGGIGGQVSQLSLCRSFGGTAVVGSTVYVPCTDGVRALRIDSAGTMHVLWHASSSITGSPVVGGGRVWSLDPGSGVLYALNPSTGAAVSHVSVGATSRFATPALYGPHVVVGTLSGVVMVSTA